MENIDLSKKVLSIIITYNSEKWIRKNLSSITESDILIIDNGSTDSTKEIVKSEFSKVRLIEFDCNLGFAKANNLGFDIAQKENYDYVFLINHDGWLLKDFWIAVKEVIQNDNYRDYGLFSPVHFDSSEKAWDFGFKKYVDQQKYIDYKAEVLDLEMINGAFLLISVNCLKAVKGFDPMFFFYGEDIDFCLRAKSSGYKIGLIKAAYVVHDRKEREMTKDRLAFHIYANSLLQIKSLKRNFLFSFFKTIYSNFLLAFKKNEQFGYLTQLYIYNIFKLISNMNTIMKSYKNYR